jgi:hypothetical protein
MVLEIVRVRFTPDAKGAKIETSGLPSHGYSHDRHMTEEYATTGLKTKACGHPQRVSLPQPIVL